MKHIRWFLAVVVLSIFAGMVSAESVVSVEPEHIEVSDGDVFTVNITVNPKGNEIMGVQYILYFDNALLNVVDQNKGTFLSHDGVGTSVYKNEINNTLGIVKYGEARSSVDYGVTNSGILASITFQAIAEQGVSELHLKDVKVSDPAANPVISIEVNNGVCTIKAIKQTSIQTPTLEPSATATASAQTIRTPDVNRTSSQPLNASTTPTAVQTPPGTTQTTPTSITPSTTASQTTHTPAEKGLPGFEALFTISWMLAAFVMMKNVMKK